MCYSFGPFFHEISEYRFVKDRRVHLRTFSVLWDNNFLKQSRDIPLLGIKFFDTRNILKHRMAPLRVWDKKKLKNRDTPIIQKKFDSITFLKYKGPPTKFVCTETKFHFWIKRRSQWWNWCLKKIFENHILKTVVSFLAVSKCWSKYLYSAGI